MNYIDIVLIIPLIWGLYKGFSKGLIIELASLAGLALGFWGSVRFSSYLGNTLSEVLSVDEKIIPLLSFALTFLGILVLVHLLARLINKFIKFASLSLLNKIAGSAFGLIKFGLILSIILVFVNSIDEKAGIIDQNTKQQSLLYQPVLNLSVMIIPALKNGDFSNVFHYTEQIKGTSNNYSFLRNKDSK